MAVTLSVNGACLDDVAKFSEQICGELSKNGSSSVVQNNGQLNAKAEGIFVKFLGSAGVEGDRKTIKESYENVLREDLGGELSSNRECRIKMVEVGRQYCTGDLNKPELIHIKWPEGKKRYYIEAANIRPSCDDDVSKSDHELKITVNKGKVSFELDKNTLKSRLIDDGTTILVTGKFEYDDGITSFSNAEVRLRNDKKIEAEMEWVWRGDDGEICTGALAVSNSIEQRWR